VSIITLADAVHGQSKYEYLRKYKNIPNPGPQSQMGWYERKFRDKILSICVRVAVEIYSR
jgi:hypothetical protein